MNEQELEQIYNQYADTVYRVCFTYLGNAADSEDAVQEVFLRLIHKQPRFSCDGDRKGWLIVTACNYCKSRLRWRRRCRTAEFDERCEKGACDDSSAELFELIAALPDGCKQVVYMHCCEGYSLADIARLSKENPSTVRSRLFYARKKLKNMLGGSEDG